MQSKSRSLLSLQYTEYQLVPLEIVEWHLCRGYVWLKYSNSSATRIFADVVISRALDDVVERRRDPQKVTTVERDEKTKLMRLVRVK